MLPGGGIERGELPMVAAIRELYEETELIATSIKLIFNFESKSTIHHVYSVSAPGVPVAHSDVHQIAWLTEPVANSKLRITAGTRSIIDKFQRHTPANRHFGTSQV